MDLSASQEEDVASTGGNLTSISYDDARIGYYGRWIDTGTGKWQGWPSGEICFTVSGVTSIDVLVSVVDANATDSTLLGYVIDNSPSEVIFLSPTSAAHIFSGDLVVTVPLPDTGIHNIILKPLGYGYASGFAATCKCIFKGVQSAATGAVTGWAQGSVDLQIIGDSWTAAYNGWTRLLDRAHFKINSVAIPGYKASDLRPKYKYDYSGVVSTADPSFAGIVVMFGVNEYNQAVSTATFKTNMLALIDEIRLRQAAPIPIVMVALPDNTNAGKIYSTYKTVLDQITALRAQTSVCDLSTLTASLAGYWLADGTDGHLDYRGKPIVAAYLDNYLKTTVGI